MVYRKLQSRRPIKRAEPWLLDALPLIGVVTAQTVVGYRDGNGRFRISEDSLKVSGLSQGIPNKIKDYVTVSD